MSITTRRAFGGVLVGLIAVGASVAGRVEGARIRASDASPGTTAVQAPAGPWHPPPREACKRFPALDCQRFNVRRPTSERLAAVFGDKYRVGMTEAADFLQINSRLNAEHHIFSQNIRATLRNPGGLVIPQPKPVAGSVQPYLFTAVPFLLKKIVEGTVQFAARNARACLVKRDTSGLSHRLEHLPDLRGWRSGEVGPLTLRRIAVDPGKH